MPTKGWHKHYESVSKVESEVKYWMAVTKCEGDHFSLEYYGRVKFSHTSHIKLQKDRKATKRNHSHVPVDEMWISLIRPPPRAGRHLCLCRRQRVW